MKDERQRYRDCLHRELEELIDHPLEKLAAQGWKGRNSRRVHGHVAVSSAKSSYYNEIVGNDRFWRSAGHGARVRRLLWSSTSIKNPDYSGVNTFAI